MKKMFKKKSADPPAYPVGKGGNKKAIKDEEDYFERRTTILPNSSGDDAESVASMIYSTQDEAFSVTDSLRDEAPSPLYNYQQQQDYQYGDLLLSDDDDEDESDVFEVSNANNPPPPPPLPGKGKSKTKSRVAPKNRNIAESSQKVSKKLESRSLAKLSRFPKNEGTEEEEIIDMERFLDSRSIMHNPQRPSKMIQQSALIAGRRALKTDGNRNKALSFDRKDLFDSAEVEDHFPIMYCKTFLQSQMSIGDIGSLNLNGIDQLTDAFFYTLLQANLYLPQLKVLLCQGCIHLTDQGVKWIASLCRKLKTVNLNGCSNLTEKALHSLTSMKTPPEEVLMVGTNVGIDMPDPGDGKLSISCNLSGCPVVSTSTGPGAKSNIPLNIYKAVILNDKKLISGVGQKLVNKSGDPGDEKGVSFWPDWQPAKSNYRFNLFEVAHDEPSSDLVLSNGCVVILPYPENGAALETVVESLFSRKMKVDCKYPDSTCLVLGVSEQMERGKLGELVVNNVCLELQKKMDTLNKTMKEEITKVFKYKWIIEGFLFPNQIYFTRWVKQSEMMENSKFVHNSSSGELTASMKWRPSPPIGKTLDDAVKRIEEALPYYKSISRNLQSISSSVKDSPLQPLTSAYTLVPENVRKNLHERSALPHVEKGLEILHLRGMLMYFGSKENGLVTGKVAEFIKAVNQALSSEATKSSLPCLEPGAPCWKQQDLILALKGSLNEKQAEHLSTVLVSEGCLLTINGEGVDDGVSNVNPVLVHMDGLPDNPPNHLASLWPCPLPVSEIQVDMFYTFVPALPSSLLTTYFSHINRISQLSVLWRHGVFIHQGPVDVCIRQDCNDKGMPVIAVGCRTFKPTGSSAYTQQCLWATLTMFTRILDFVIQKYQVFAKVTVPCPTCVPGKELSRQLQSESCNQFNTIEFTSGLKCKREGDKSKQFSKEDILGPVGLIHSVVPRHSDWYLDLTKGSFVHSYKCYQCNRVTRDRSGQKKFLCPNCGTCARCIEFLAEVEKTLMPGFSNARGSKGCLGSSNLKNSLLPLNYSMVPGLFSEMRLTMMRGKPPLVILKLVKSDLPVTFDLENGTVTGPGPDQSHSDTSFQCNEGDTVFLQILEGKTFAEIEILFHLNGFVLWRAQVEKQSIVPQFASKNDYVGFVLCTPGIKAYWQTETRLDRLNERMCLEFDETEDKIVSARVTGNNGKVVTLVTDHRAEVSLSNAKTVELTSERLHPPGYAQSIQMPLNGSTGGDSYGTYLLDLPKSSTLAPLWLFSEAQRGICTMLPTHAPEIMPCLYFPSPAAIQCQISQTVPMLEKFLYRNGGIDFTGSAITLLPSNKTTESFHWPARHLLGNHKTLQCHPLCYIRAHCDDMLNLYPAKQDVTERNPYWNLHFLNAEGFLMPESFTELDVLPLILSWHILLASQQHFLPDTVDEFCPDVANHMSVTEIEPTIHQYVKWQASRLMLMMGPDFSTLSEWYKAGEANVFQASKALLTEVKEQLSSTGLNEFVTVLARDTIYLCPAHISTLQTDAQLEEFPSDDFSCYKTFITSLCIQRNKLGFLPENFFAEFASLKDLQLGKNELFILPLGISQCKDLRNLKLSDNQLQTLPSDLAECKMLCLLDISGNPMDEIPEVVTKVTSLERLYMSHMQLLNLPENIGNLTNLDVLNASGNCLSNLPKSFSQLKKLTQLYLNGIPWMPLKQNTLLSKEHFEKFLEKHSQLLDWLADHDIDKALLYEQFDEDENGTLDVNEVAKLNATLFNIFPRFGHKGKDLPEDESFSGLPEEILGLENLEYLSIQYQGLVTLPESIEKLKKLSKINLANNPYLTTVAASAGNLPLQMLALDDCPSLKTPPKEIRSRGFSSTYAYLRRLLTGSVDCHRTKLMFVGLGGAGKTSLSRALLSGNLKTEANVSEAITDGIDISTWTVKSGEDHITYSVWDFAGQTVYYNTHQFFLSDRAVYLLLWNIRLGHEHAGLDFWLSSISVHAPKAPIFVVGTHLDKVSKTEIPIADMKQKYPQIAGFHFISSHSGQGVSELQKHIFDVTLQQQYMGEKIPGVWLKFETEIMKARVKQSVIKYQEIEHLAGEAGIFDQSEVSQAVQFLHDLGSLQYFNNEFLKSNVVINPQWIVDVMTCVVSVKNSPIKEGRLYHKDIGQVWKDYPAELHQWLLRLTEEFDLTFPITDQQLNLVPCLLPEIQPEIDWPELDRNSSERETKMIYKFTYLPAGLFNRGQVRLYQFCDSSVIWKRGSLLRKIGHQALLQQIHASELVVRVQGPRPENFLFLVHEVFEGLIAESFHGVTYDFLMPCPDCLKAASREPHMFAASTVRRASELKAPFLQCLKYFHTISVIDLLASMPPDNNTDYDIHLVSAVRGLKDLKKDLSADLFISYSQKNMRDCIGPDKVHNDLSKAGYKCWYPKDDRLKNVDQMAKALMDCQVFVALVSNDYVLDKNCCDMFKYARLILKKPVILVVVGTGFEWRQSKLGILLADDLFVNMQKKDSYQDKFNELVSLIRDKSGFEKKDVEHPPCFISYSWKNSAVAVAKGTAKKDGALGFGDPRKVKDFLEKNGVKCWIDVEKVGANGLFEDIAEGLLNAKVMVACVSDEYATSSNCQLEFRFAANTLKLPVVLAIMGTGNSWRAKEVGFLSIDYPMVSFQEKSESAHQRLLTFVKEKLNSHSEEDAESKKKKKNENNESHSNMSFQELYELAQRKFLRQVAHYAAKQETLYPRLFVADFVSENIEDEKLQSEEKKPKKTKLSSSLKFPGLSSMSSQSSLDMEETLHDFHNKRYCFYILCEHEEGWHSCSSPVLAPDQFGQSRLEKYSPYLARITTILRYNRSIMLNCMAGKEGDNYLHWLEQNPQAVESDFQNTYQQLREEIINADESGMMGKLSRCHMPNGKTVWLCEEHQKASRVTVLSNEFAGGSATTTESTTENMILEYLGQMDNRAVMEEFRSVAPRTRKAVNKRLEERQKRELLKPKKSEKEKEKKQKLKETTEIKQERNTTAELHTAISATEEKYEPAEIPNNEEENLMSKGSKTDKNSVSDVLAPVAQTRTQQPSGLVEKEEQGNKVRNVENPESSNNNGKSEDISSAEQKVILRVTATELQQMKDQLKQVDAKQEIAKDSSQQGTKPGDDREEKYESLRRRPYQSQSVENLRRRNKSAACNVV